MKTSTICLLSLLACSGCGGASDAGAVDNLVNQIAEQTCAWEFRCCTDPEILRRNGNKYKDQTTCVAFAKLTLENALYAQRLAVRQGRVKIDGTKANECIAQMMAKACNPAPGSPPPMPPPPGFVDPCTQILIGNTAIGEACQFPNECIKGARCVPTGGTGDGVCVPYQQEMQICNQSSDCDPTVRNLYCARQDYKCHLRSPLGGPCAYTVDMMSMMPTLPMLLECDNSTNNVYCSTTTMACEKLPGAGQQCLQPRPPGVNSTCDTGLSCDTSAGPPGMCRAPGGAGEPCSPQFPCKNDGTVYCDQTTMPSTCKALPGLGGDCQVSNQQCLKPFYCSTMTMPSSCAQPAALDMPCSNQAPVIRCDTNLYCDTTMGMPACKAKLADGASCTSGQMCLSGICNNTCLPQGNVQCIGRM